MVNPAFTLASTGPFTHIDARGGPKSSLRAVPSTVGVVANKSKLQKEYAEGGTLTVSWSRGWKMSSSRARETALRVQMPAGLAVSRGLADKEKSQ